ncbi:ATPase, T2SS/T4P/T4SS family [Exiguobacterium antarcticum]|uniref:ATPase, T2SS/T4P/T4SS family n=1 Tax=Exiguobacterium antarcticum TaxID=132920 RepID=A0ABT6R575_9BACL|nr:ATPase, T2SS/T4P/T4SS family [Exiguobacterium antarcticum]MDI3235968.1 ATPase, T2SS/T4P/T4SS family [Exiguobacterium antarcticum]
MSTKIGLPIANKADNKIDLYEITYAEKQSKAKLLGEEEQDLIDQSVEKLRKYLIETNKSLLESAFLDQEKRIKLSSKISEYIQRNSIAIPNIEQYELVNTILDEITGFGIIQPLIDREDITDVFVNGTKSIRYIGPEGDTLFVDSLTKEVIRFSSEDEILRLAYRLVNVTESTLTTAKPYTDTALPRLRVNIMKSDISGIGTSISIRKSSSELRATRERMLSTNQASEEELDFFKAAVQAKLKILIVGGTGTGKTEFIKHLAQHIPDNERTLVAEDDPELFLHELYPEKHFYTFECRLTGNPETDIPYSIGLKLGLRQHPRRIIVGESRGEEAMQMIEFFESGHSGFTSIHAESSEEALQRLKKMCLRSGVNLSGDDILQSIAGAFDLIVVLEKLEDNNRYLTQVSEIKGYSYEKNQVELNDLFLFKYQKDDFVFDSLGKVTKLNGSHMLTNKFSERLKRKMSRSLAETELIEKLI